MWDCCPAERVPDSCASNSVVVHRMSVQLYTLTKSVSSCVSKDVNVRVTPCTIDPVAPMIQVQLESLLYGPAPDPSEKEPAASWNTPHDA
jgi:hypothetical protein